MRARLLLTGLCLISSLAWLFYMRTPNKFNADIASTQKHTNEPAVTIKQVTLHEYSKKKDYELVLNAEQSAFNHHTETVVCEHVVCTILKKNSDVAALYATQSLIDRAHKTITCNGPVHGQVQGVTFQGSDIIYNFTDHVMTTQQPMSYMYRNIQLTAAQSVVDIAEHVVEMRGGVKTEFVN